MVPRLDAEPEKGDARGRGTNAGMGMGRGAMRTDASRGETIRDDETRKDEDDEEEEKEEEGGGEVEGESCASAPVSMGERTMCLRGVVGEGEGQEGEEGEDGECSAL